MSAPTELQGTLSLNWLLIGSVVIDLDKKVRFPKVASKPGLYRFEITKADGSKGLYVGETDNLQRRFAHYRSPGPTQPTNLRLNALFKDVLSAKGDIALSVVVDQAWIKWSETVVEADLSRKHVRRMFENFVLCAERATEIEDLNK